ncbi:hypothetical protein ASE03_14110 [Kitasatospora sp. Root187]|nr:hypothetical protein ASC99_09275 [Kitasatospora sp. Root107]KRB76771.1 hypothetical protein ASE03_14110 [Kitasatospora sp. Root187]
MTPPASAVSQLASAPDGPVQVARAKAKSTGKPVTVDELTTPTSLTVANPSGTLTRTDHQQPARVKKDGSWTPVDATLAKNPDGTYAPKATPSGVVLSGGGSGPLATFTDAKGRSLSLTLPFALPAPTVSGGSVSYANVLPDVDLKATVTEQGAFREVLVVHNAAAAANPALKNLRLATATNGLTVTADQAGNITAKASDGAAVFNAPAPVMWDSNVATPPAADAAKSLGAPAAAAAEAPTAPAAPSTTVTVDASDSAVSSEKGPGRDAHLAPIAVSTDSTGLTLTPDAEQFTNPGTTWPVYIDPYVNPVTGGTNHYTQVKEGCPTTPTYDQAQENGEGIGFQQYSSQCYGLYRSFFEFDISYLNSRMVISSSTLTFTETHGGDKNCYAPLPVTLKLTGAINGNTVWPGPGEVATIGSTTVLSSNVSMGCGNHPVPFDVTGTVRQWQTNGNLTFGLYGNESKYDTNYGFMRFNTNPSMLTVYDIAPNTPTNVGTTPASQNPAGPACGSGSPGWIGMTSLNGNASNITLDATLTTDMSGVNLKAGYHVWDNMANNGSGSPADAAWPVSPGWSATGTTVRTNIGGPVSDGHQYGWNVWASDGTLGSPSSAYCYFNVDLSPPTLAAFTPSAAFPPLGSGTPTTAHAGDTATVSVSTTDPVPGGCTLNACISSGVQTFQYSLDTNIPASGANTVTGTVTNGVATASIPITVPNNQWGTHTLYVRAIDNAGNTQATAATYSFYAPWNPTAKVTAGDLTGDGKPDMLATTTDGNLILIGGNSDPSAAPVTASTSGQSPERDGWNNYLIAHRGSLTQQGIDDLFAYNKSSHQMYGYKNDATTLGSDGSVGTAGYFTRTESVQNPLGHRACTTSNGPLTCAGHPSDWSQLTQMIAPGTLSAPIYNAAHPTRPVSLVPDLITMENGKLWYYIGGRDPSTYTRDVRPIGSGDWSNTTLVGVGNVGATVTGTGPSAITTGGTPTLWVRNNVTGSISSFPLTFDNDGNPTSVIAAPTRAPLVSGVVDTAGKNMCLDIASSNTTNGTPAQIWNCNGGTAQSFTLGTDNTIHVLGKCLDVNGGYRDNGTLVQIWDCNNTGAQQWIPGPFPGTLQNPQSGRCLDDPNSNQTPGTQLVIWDCGGSANANWAATTPGNALPTPQPILPVGINGKTYPAISTPGDANGDGNPELHAISTSGQIVSYPGAAPVRSDRWKLTDSTNTVKPANSLTLNGGAAFTADAARGTVLTGNGTTAYAASTTASVDTSKSFTVTAWAKLSSLANSSSFVSQPGTSAGGFHLYYSSSAQAFAFGHAWADDTTGNQSVANGPTTGNAAPKADTWTHLAGTYDATSKQLTLYVNGATAGTAAYNGTTWNATGPVQIGRRALSTNTFKDYLAGSVSDARTYPTALVDSSVRADMADVAQFSPATTLGYLAQPTDRWRLADNKDSIRTNDLTLTGGAGFTTDATRGTVLNLDGSNGSRASTTGPVVNTTQSYTVSAWAYLNNTNAYANIVGQSGTNVSAFYLQYSRAFNAWTFTAPNTDTTYPTAFPAAFASTPPALNTWTHLVGVYNATNQTMSLYINGTLVSTATNTTAWNATGPLTIGNAKNENPFPGKISDVQTWTTALPAAAIATLNTGTHPTPVQLS